MNPRKQPDVLSPWPADAVERRPVSALVPYARNSRMHPPAQILQIAASLKEWGWTMPVLVDEGNGIIAGHGRVLAAEKLGIQEVPVMIARGWSEAKKRAYVIADNKLALNSSWDQDMLAMELGDLREDGAGWIELTGFDGADIARLLDAGGTGADAGAGSAKEIDPDDYAMNHRCPRCGFEFDKGT